MLCRANSRIAGSVTVSLSSPRTSNICGGDGSRLGLMVENLTPKLGRNSFLEKKASSFLTSVRVGCGSIVKFRVRHEDASSKSFMTSARFRSLSMGLLVILN